MIFLNGKKKITLGFYESSLCKFRIIWVVLVLLRMSMLSKQKFRTFQLLKALVEKKKKKRSRQNPVHSCARTCVSRWQQWKASTQGCGSLPCCRRPRASPKCKCLQRKGIVQEKSTVYLSPESLFSINLFKIIFLATVCTMWALGSTSARN